MERQRTEPTLEDVRQAAIEAGIALAEERVLFVHEGALFLSRSVEVCRGMVSKSSTKAS